MTEKNGRDADLDPQRFAPRVVPIRGFSLPAPPGWQDDKLDQIKTLRDASVGALTPEDYTVNGHVRCTYLKGDKTRCNNAVEPGTIGCKMHNAKAARGLEKEQDETVRPDAIIAEGKAQGTNRADRVERIRAHLELVALSAVLAVQMVLEDELAKPSDRLKAAEIVLDRTIGRTLQVQAEDSAERDLDIEIMELADSVLPATGTDGAAT